MSTVFVFNASLNDVAPVSPISFPVDYMRMKKEWFVCGFRLYVFFYLYRVDRVE